MAKALASPFRLLQTPEMTSGFSRKCLNDFDVLERLLTTERYLKALKYFNYTSHSGFY